MSPRRPSQSAANKHGFVKIVVILVAAVIIIVAAIIWHWNHNVPPSGANASNSQATSGQSNTNTSGFDKNKYSINDPVSIWVVVNKQRILNPKNYVPRQLVVPDVSLKGSPSAENMHVSAVMAPHLKELFDAAAQAGFHLKLSSGYRSYNYQISVYNQEVASNGAAKADQESARPGHSEHQTGLAADVEPASGKCDLSQCFGDTPEGQWLAKNAWRYGFIIRYPSGKQNVTGYEYEPWHIRYVGTDLSTEMHNTNITTLEEFFGLPAAPNY